MRIVSSPLSPHFKASFVLVMMHACLQEWFLGSVCIELIKMGVDTPLVFVK
jgi:hypothetical protein